MSDSTTNTEPLAVNDAAGGSLSSGEAFAFAVAAARELSDRRCDQVMVLDVRGLSSVCDYVVLGTGTSDRQAKAAGQHVEDLGGEMGMSKLASDADAQATWVVVDFATVMVHVFEPATRAHYDLEMLWGDAPRVPWRRETEPGTERSDAEGDRD
ncbi:MAG: ribosome silencing factor [Planctomycetota bacterium]